LREGRARLEEAEIDTAVLDARLLLQEATGLTHEELIAEPGRPVNEGALTAYRAMIARRAGHEPVSRITGTREFYGRAFAVTPAVLDPRPETETLIEAALSALPRDRPTTVLDLGTGSGAIIVTLLAERPLACGTATDVSAGALATTRRNAIRHGVEPRLTLITANWWQGVAGQFDLIVSNPPYIPSRALAGLQPEVRDFDPRIALDGGAEGCDAYRLIAAGAAAHLAAHGSILLEIGDGQVNDVTETFCNHGLGAAGRWADLAGRIRCLGFASR
jgi:release factor glutamine methyltransferase